MKARIYSYLEDIKAIAFLDILGFGNLTTRDGENEFDGTYWKFVNAIEIYRNPMAQPYKDISRDVPIEPALVRSKSSFWYKNHIEGSVGFQYVSDALVLYSTCLEHLVEVISSIMGAAIVWGVPLRGGIALGGIFHSEFDSRPGIATPMYGPGLTQAVKLEQAVSGSALRIYLASDVENLLRSNIRLSGRVIPGSSIAPPQFKWWYGAVNGTFERESVILQSHWEKWETEKKVGQWFCDPHKADADAVIALAIADLAAQGR